MSNPNKDEQALEAWELTESDLDALFDFEATNADYFLLERETPLTREEVSKSFSFVPPSIPLDKKKAHGYFDKKGGLVAFTDCLFGYPDETTLFIGLFLVHGKMHGQGIGRAVLASLLASARAGGFTRVRLACLKANERARRFWEKSGFTFSEERVRIKEVSDSSGAPAEKVLLYELAL